MAGAAWNVADRAIQDNVASAGPALLSALLSATGNRAAATQLLRTTLALAEERVEESVGSELPCVEAVVVQDEEEIDASFVDAVVVTATVQETAGMVVRQLKSDLSGSIGGVRTAAASFGEKGATLTDMVAAEIEKP